MSESEDGLTLYSVMSVSQNRTMVLKRNQRMPVEQAGKVCIVSDSVANLCCSRNEGNPYNVIPYKIELFIVKRLLSRRKKIKGLTFLVAEATLHVKTF